MIRDRIAPIKRPIACSIRMRFQSNCLCNCILYNSENNSKKNTKERTCKYKDISE